MSNFEIGDRVRVISECKNIGKFGVISEYGDYSYQVKVLLDGLSKAYTFNKASLQNMDATTFRIGDPVRVISDCLNRDRIGTVAHTFGSKVTVKFSNDEVLNFKSKSLNLAFSELDDDSVEFDDLDEFCEVHYKEDFEEIYDVKTHNNIESKWKLVFSSGIQDLMTNFVTELVDDVVIFDFSFKTIAENNSVQYVVEIEGIGGNNAKRVSELFAKVEME